MALPLGLVAFLATCLPQQIEMFPPGQYVTHCRALGTAGADGGDDDHNNVFFIHVDRRVADGTPLPDFYVHLWDGDHGGNPALSGAQDYRGPSAVFEYRLYGGAGAAINDEAPPGSDPGSWSGVLIDIDGDAGDDTLRTDDPDDLDATGPEDLRDQDFSLIAVDVDAHPGDRIMGRHVYKFVIDGTFSNVYAWNRYEIQVSRDAARRIGTGMDLFAYEVTYAGRGSNAPAATALQFRVPPTANHAIDIQTLDLDYPAFQAGAALATRTQTFDDAATYESADALRSGAWQWTSLNQPQSSRPGGDGRTGLAYSTLGQEGLLWTLDVDPGSLNNPFSLRMMEITPGAPALPMFFKLRADASDFDSYGAGALTLSGDGIPKVGGTPFALDVAGAPPGALGYLAASLTPDDRTLPSGITLYIGTVVRERNFVYDANGAYHQSVRLPAGTPARVIYVQAFAQDGGGVQSYSNGLRVAIQQ